MSTKYKWGDVLVHNATMYTVIEYLEIDTSGQQWYKLVSYAQTVRASEEMMESWFLIDPDASEDGPQ